MANEVKAIRCPSCTQLNEAGAKACSACNFPLVDGSPMPLAADTAPASAGTSAPASTPGPGAPKADEGVPAIDIRRIRPIRPRRPAPADQALQTQLIVGLGGLAVVITILWVAWQGFHKNNAPSRRWPARRPSR